MSSNNHNMNPTYLAFVAGINTGGRQINFATYSPSNGTTVQRTDYNTGAGLNRYDTRSTNSTSYGPSSSYSTSGGSYGGRR